IDDIYLIGTQLLRWRLLDGRCSVVFCCSANGAVAAVAAYGGPLVSRWFCKRATVKHAFACSQPWQFYGSNTQWAMVNGLAKARRAERAKPLPSR
ncbi:hypothetical protein NPIL_218771, partial [Nephila pilipes]